METVRKNEYTKVLAKDKPDKSGACHHYEIIGVGIPDEFAWIDFQKGPIKEVDVNGCQIEDLFAICIHRLEGFQSGEFACEANSIALRCAIKALDHLDARTRDRQRRGVEGLNKA